LVYNFGIPAQDKHLYPHSDILEYLAGAKLGYAIPVKRIKELKHPVSLDYLRKNYAFTAPQNYLIADKKPDLLGYLSSLLG